MTMVQFNLLPDVKQEYVKAQRSKRTVIVGASLVAAVALAIFLILFVVVNIAQKKHLRDLNRDIQSYSTTLQNTPDLNKILTIQNQLSSLPELHAQKPVASRLFNYLSQITPAQASIVKLHLDFSSNSMTINGTADSLSTVNKYADTLKFTTFAPAGGDKQTSAFSHVVLSSFSRDDKTTNYALSFNFDPAIFDGASAVTLTVPKTITTRSETEKPAALFQAPATNGKTQ